MGEPAPRLWTVGHGARPLDAFVAVLASARIAVVVDVRQFPGSPERRTHDYARKASPACSPHWTWPPAK